MSEEELHMFDDDRGDNKAQRDAEEEPPERFEGKVSEICQCEDLLILKPDESEMAGLKVKSHLESLMGTDVIKLNDREYMLSLQNRLMNEYESAMDRQEEQRSEKERRRQRRLYIEGLQDLPNIDLKTPRAKSTAGTTRSSTLRSGRPSTYNAGETIYSEEEDEEFHISPGSTPNPTRRKYKDVKSRRPTKYAKDAPKNSAISGGTAGTSGSIAEKKRPISERIEEDEEDMNTQRALLMRQLRREKTVKGMYRTADLVLAAPVAELNNETEPAAGSPHGSLTAKEEKHDP